MTFTGKSVMPIMKRYFLFRYLFFISVPLFMALAAGCGNKEDCQGCDKEAPWSNVNADYCYTTKERCETETNEECYRCD
jgi:hypothetical protein